MAIIKEIKDVAKGVAAPFYRNFDETLIDSEEIMINGIDYIIKETKRKKADMFTDITYVNGNKKYFIGRYIINDDRIALDFSKKFIIVYTWNFDRTEGKVLINNILSLYDLEDKTEVVGSFKELGTMFNNSLGKQLEFAENNSSKLNYRSDIQRKIRH